MRPVMARWLAGLLVALTLVGLPALAVEPDEILNDPKLEARARDISAGLRCLVCQNQSIDDSNAPLARDLRILVRERLKAGDSNEEVVDFVTERYGDYVLLRPPFNLGTLLLWLAPILVLIGAVVVALRAFGGPRPPATPAPALSGAEEDRLRALLAEDDDQDPSKTTKG
jgi:cytochrome c-type biogenesis protein CcmH